MAEPLEAGDDPEAWHHIDPLEPGRMRRRRRIDVSITNSIPEIRTGPATGAARAQRATIEPVIAVDAMFRDSHGEPDGSEVVLHEYTLAVFVSYGDGRILEVLPRPRVLPFPECPAAVAYTTQLIGVRIGELRQAVTATLRGTKGCTHLNDLLRVLGDVPYLAAALPTGQAPGWAATKP